MCVLASNEEEYSIDDNDLLWYYWQDLIIVVYYSVLTHYLLWYYLLIQYYYSWPITNYWPFPLLVTCIIVIQLFINVTGNIIIPMLLRWPSMIL